MEVHVPQGEGDVFKTAKCPFDSTHYYYDHRLVGLHYTASNVFDSCVKS